MCGANGNPNTCTDFDEILHTQPNLSKESFGLTPAHSPTCGGA